MLHSESAQKYFNTQYLSNNDILEKASEGIDVI